MEAVLQTQAIAQTDREPARGFDYDIWLAGAALALLCIGLIMVVSTSVAIAERREFAPLHYFWRQLFAAGLGLVVAGVLLHVPLRRFEQFSTSLLFVAIVSLIAVLMPGLGHEVNGSMRWLDLGLFTVQASEPTKLAVVVYMAAYLVRHNRQVRADFIGFIKPIGVITVIAGDRKSVV